MLLRSVPELAIRHFRCAMNGLFSAIRLKQVTAARSYAQKFLALLPTVEASAFDCADFAPN